MIREATTNDVPAIVAMGEWFIDDVYPASITFNDAALGDLTQRLIDGAGAVFVAETESAIVGMIALIVVQNPMSDELVATELVWWVNPNARGGRAALDLLREAESWAKSKGATRLQMIAPSDKVCRFYEKLGFQRVEVAYMRAL